MKRKLSLILGILVLLSSLSSFGTVALAEGEGTEENPYIITSEAEFNAIRNNPAAYYVLQADIVLSENYVPFEFSGSIVGDNTENLRSITVKISAKSSYSAPLGLFTVINNAVIKNIALKGRVDGYSYVGGFFGRSGEHSESTVLENLVNYAQITAKGTHAGGIGAVASDKTESSRLINKGYIKAGGNAGGIFATAYNMSLCANNGTVVCDSDYAGGIVSELKGKISESYNSGNVIGTSSVGGIAGTVSETGTVIENSFNTGSVSSSAVGVNSSGGILGGIKRLPDVNCEIKNSYNAGSVEIPGFINSQYIKYDETNYITTENCYYNTVSDDDVAGLLSFSDMSNLASKISVAFAYNKTDNVAELVNLPYEKYTDPQYVSDVKEEVPEVEPVEVQMKEAELLKALGIIDNITNYDEAVTRGEFADLISRTFLYNLQYLNAEDENAFYDVGPVYAYYNGIKAVSDLKIMTADGYNRFYPDREITGNEAVTALIRALGYEVYAKANGGYPTGYLYEAKQIKLTNGLSGLGSDVLDKKTVVKLLYNALFVNIVTVGDVDANGQETLFIHSDSLYLDYIHSVYKYDVVLSDNGFTDSGDFYEDTGKVGITDYKTGEVKFVKADKNIAPLIGQRLEMFVREENDLPEETVFYAVNDDVTVTKLIGRKITNQNTSGLYYENEDGSKVNKLSFMSSKLPAVYINGRKTKRFDADDFKKDNAAVFAIDNNKDNYIDCVNVYVYDYEVIAGTVSDSGLISPYSKSSYDIDLNEEDAIYTFTADSDVFDINGIREKNTVSVVETGTVNNGKKLYILTVSEDTSEGTFDGYYDEYITVGGIDYLISKTMRESYVNYKTDFEYGSMVTVFINSFGEISFISGNLSEGKNYGYVLEAGLKGSFDPTGVVRLLDINGVAKNYSISEKVRYVKQGEEKAVNDIPSFVNEVKASNDSLIVYEINENNEIVKVVFPDKAREDDEVYNMNNFTERFELTESTLYRYTTLGGIEVNDTLVFVVPYEYETDGSDSLIQKNYFAYNSYYGGKTEENVKFYDVGRNGIATVALYRPGEIGGAFTVNDLTGVYVFKKYTRGIDEKNNCPANIIHYYDAGIEKSIMVDNDPDFVLPDNTLPESSKINSLNDLQSGDLFTFEINKDGLAKIIGRFVNRNDFNTSGDGIWSTTGAGSTEYKNIQIYEGKLQYKSPSLMTVRLPVSGYVVRLLKYTQGTVVVYNVNRSTGKITIGNESDLKDTNFVTGAEGDTAIFIGSRNNLKGVVVYE